MAMQKICILSFSEIKRDSRVLREIQSCQDQYHTYVIGYGDWQPPENVEYCQLSKNKRNFHFLARYFFWLILGRIFPPLYMRAFWLKREYRRAVQLMDEREFDLVHANDWDALPAAVEANSSGKMRILFDAHEFSPEQEAERLLWRIFIKPFKAFLLHKYLPQAAEMITVSPGIRDLYQQEFQSNPGIILNAPNYQKTTHHKADPEKIQIVHHGYAIRGRHLEEMIRLMGLTDERYDLNFIFVEKDLGYIAELKQLAQTIAPQRINFWKALEPEHVTAFIQRFDLGFPFLKAPNKNIQNALPNKFFDFIMAGLGIIVPGLPAMGEIVSQNKNGVVMDTQSIHEIAGELNSLTIAEINQFKRNSLRLAKEFNAEKEMRKLQRIYRELLE